MSAQNKQRYGLGSLVSVLAQVAKFDDISPVAAGLATDLANLLSQLSEYSGGHIVAQPLLAAFLNKIVIHTGYVWSSDELGNLTYEYVCSQPIRDLVYTNCKE